MRPGLAESLLREPSGSRPLRPQRTAPKQAFGTHDMYHVHMRPVAAIEDAARRLDDLPMTGTRSKLAGPTAAFRVHLKLAHMNKDALDKRACSGRVFQRDGVCNSLKIGDRRLRPDYFSHLPRRFSA